MIISSCFPQMIYIDSEKTLNDVAKLFNLNKDQKSAIMVGEWFKTNNKCNEYVVKPADSFEIVAKKLNIDVNTLKNLAKTKHLYVGQKIVF